MAGSTGSTLAPAKIINLDKPAEFVVCMFNPKEYTLTKQNSWTQGKTSGASAPPLEFGSGQPASLQMQLFFDTYLSAENVDQAEDVKTYTDKIWHMMMVDPSLKEGKKPHSRPPRVQFCWGKTLTFDAVITSITQKFTLFAPNGTPVRATLDVTFQQTKVEQPIVKVNKPAAKNRPRQNPTSGGSGGERLWTVRQGETLASIAYEHYRDTSMWRYIADTNRLTQVRCLAPGTVLLLLPHE